MKYRVYAGVGGRGHKWHPYSATYTTKDEAEAAKQRAEARGILDLYNRPIKYITAQPSPNRPTTLTGMRTSPILPYPVFGATKKEPTSQTHA